MSLSFKHPSDVLLGGGSIMIRKNTQKIEGFCRQTEYLEVIKWQTRISEKSEER